MSNVVLILADDLGFSDIGCYGSEIRTPNLDRLAASGVRLTRFYNTARCSPSRASLLTGLHPHQTGIGILTNDDGPRGYPGSLTSACRTLGELLGAGGYDTALFGKWHLSSSVSTPDSTWPTRRGFDTFWGTLSGCGSFYEPGTLHDGEEPAAPEPGFYYTDAITDRTCAWIASREAPFLAYVAYTAPHWPLHAPESDVEAYRGAYAAGWDALREDRVARLRTEGLLGPGDQLSDRDPSQPAWTDVADPEWEQRRMEVYAAQVTAMDRGIGRILDTLDERGIADDTIVVFLADNGASAEELPQGDLAAFARRRNTVPAAAPDGAPLRIGNTPDIVPGPADTYASYGQAWANLSNTPFRFYKRWVHEGGIATPFVVRWPAGGLAEGGIAGTAFQLTDVVPTLLAACGAEYPSGAPPLEGRSMLPALRGEPVEDQTLYWEHIGNQAVRHGRWKIVREHGSPWELYDMETDRTELDDLAATRPEVVAELAELYDTWAARVGVIPREEILVLYRELLGQGVQVQGTAVL